MAFDLTGDIVTAFRPPPSILLAETAHVVASKNDTTADAKSRGGRTVEVTFWIADPPALSFCGFHFSKSPFSKSEDNRLQIKPHVVAAEGRFVLIRTRFAFGDGEDEYFMYKGDMKSPSLKCIPLPEYFVLNGVSKFGILPRGDEYLLVGLYDDLTTSDYKLRIYSSEDQTWRTEELLNPCPDAGMVTPEKVITLGEGVLGMVDFWHGILVLDLLQKQPVARYIPLPDPLPENIQKLKVLHPGASPRRYRDLTCSDGMIKFIEMEHRVIVKESREITPEKPKVPTHKSILYDSELIRGKKQKNVEDKSKKLYLMNGWRAETRTRVIESNCWFQGCSVDTDDITVDDTFVELLSGQSDKSLGNLSFKNLNSAWPILSIDGDDLLYLKTLPNLRASHAWVVAVDLAKKTAKVEKEEAFGAEERSLGRYIWSQQLYHLCTLSKHLNMTPGTKVSAFCEILVADTLVDDPNSTAVCLDGPDSCEAENKHPGLSAEKFHLAQNGAQNVIGSAHILHTCPHQNSQACLNEPDSCEPEKKHPRLSAEVCLNEPDSCEPENKRPRLSAEKFNLAQNGVQSVVQNAHILHTCPYQNSQDGGTLYPLYPGRSWWPHENNLPPYFSSWGGPSVPWNAPYAPAPNISYGNYYPLNYQQQWWQPALSKQQPAPSSVFGHNEATQPYLSNWYGASNHGYLQQLPAHNLYPYGLRSDYGNYQLQTQHFPPIQELPAQHSAASDAASAHN